MVSRTEAIQGYKPSAFFDFFRAARRRSAALAASQCMRYYLHGLVTNQNLWVLRLIIQHFAKPSSNYMSCEAHFYLKLRALRCHLEVKQGFKRTALSVRLF